MAINSKNKGSAFERTVCKELSLWWTSGESDAVFHRSVTSGGFATTRAKVGKKSENAYGDIMVLDAIGKPLLDLCCFELKCGYGKWCVLDAMDRPFNSAPSTIEKFWEQARDEAERAQVPYGVVIAKRDRKQPIMLFSKEFFACLSPFAGMYNGPRLYVELLGDPLVFVPFREWLEYVTPESIRSMLGDS